GGTYQLKFDQTTDSSATTQDAVLALNLAGQVGATNLEVDFWAQQISDTYSNSAYVYVSGNGTTWTLVSNSYISPPAVNQQTHYVFDLDQALSSAGIALDADVYLKLTHSGY